MTNAQIILIESVKLMEEGIIKGSGIKGITPEGKEIELPEQIHTYQAWKSLGYQVRKGEKSIAKFAIWKHVSAKEAEEDESGELHAGHGEKMFMKVSSFFTKSQVDPIEKKEKVS